MTYFLFLRLHLHFLHVLLVRHYLVTSAIKSVVKKPWSPPFVLMGGSTVVIGLLPNYAHKIGIWAPILLAYAVSVKVLDLVANGVVLL